MMAIGDPLALAGFCLSTKSYQKCPGIATLLPTKSISYPNKNPKQHAWGEYPASPSPPPSKTAKTLTLPGVK
jgi:hypothetical protein